MPIEFIQRRRSTSVLALEAVLLLVLACREPLPAYEDPRNVLTAHLRGNLIYRSDLTAVAFSLVIVNRFDETLDGSVDVGGWMTVTLLRDPTTVRTYEFTAVDLMSRQYDASSGHLRLDPGDSALIQVYYDFRDDTGRSLPNTVMPMEPDPTCPAQRVVSGRELFTARASVRIFSRLAAVEPEPLGYVLCLPIPWVPSNTCPGPTGSHRETSLCP